MKPTSGRIVHFVSHQRNDVPAIVTSVINETKVNLHIFWDNSIDEHPDGLVSQQSAYFDNNAEPQEKSWHWPPREDSVGKAAGPVAVDPITGLPKV